MPKTSSSPVRRTVAVAVALAAALTVPGLSVVHAVPTTVKKPKQDFNGDGYEDLAVGAPDAQVGGRAKAGYVAVLYGSAQGLGAGTRKVYTQASPGVPGGVEAGDLFGSRLTAADLDGDGYTDAQAGAVWVFGAGSAGATATRSFSFGARTLGTVAGKAQLGAAFPG